MAAHLITDQAAREIAVLRAKQDQNARALGILVWEYEDKRQAWEAETGGLVSLTKIGALVYELEEAKRKLMMTIHATREQQRTAGENALREIGIDPNAGDYVIDNGRALKIVAGAYVEDF